MCLACLASFPSLIVSNRLLYFACGVSDVDDDDVDDDVEHEYMMVASTLCVLIDALFFCFNTSVLLVYVFSYHYNVYRS